MIVLKEINEVLRMPKSNRRSTIYREIEKFKDYELFIGIIYEMYLRHMVYINNIENDNVVDYINKLRNEQYKNINNYENTIYFRKQNSRIFGRIVFGCYHYLLEI